MPSTRRRREQQRPGTGTARLTGGPFDGHVVDVALSADQVPSEDIFVRAFEDVPVVIDDFVRHHDWRRIEDLVADGWVRYFRVVGINPPPGHPWPFQVWDRPG